MFCQLLLTAGGTFGWCFVKRSIYYDLWSIYIWPVFYGILLTVGSIRDPWSMSYYSLWGLYVICGIWVIADWCVICGLRVITHCCVYCVVVFYEMLFTRHVPVTPMTYQPMNRANITRPLLLLTFTNLLFNNWDDNIWVFHQVVVIPTKSWNDNYLVLMRTHHREKTLVV